MRRQVIRYAVVAAAATSSRPSLPSSFDEHVSVIQRELSKLVPLYTPLAGKKKVTAAELISRTAFAKQKTAGAARCCSNDVGIWEIASRADKNATVCTTCLEQRLHFLASEHFCYFTWQAATNKSVPLLPGSFLERELLRSFTSLTHFEEELRTFALNKAVPGWTWLVWNPKAKATAPPVEESAAAEKSAVPAVLGRLELVNFPGNMTPLTVGMWPIACFNITDRAVALEYAAAIEQAAAGGLGDQSPAPAWSRAARNPQAAVARKPSSRNHVITLEMLRASLIAQAVASLNYAFLDTQLQAALETYAAGTHDAKVAAHRVAMARQVKDAFVHHLPQITVVEDLAQADALPPPEPAAPQEAEQLTLQQVNVASAENESGEADDSSTAAVATETPTEEMPAAAQQDASPEAAAADSAGDARPFKTRLTREDGTEVFIYSDDEWTEVAGSRVTFYMPDKTVIVKEPEFTKWTFSDGSVTTQFADGTVERKDAAGNVQA